MSLTPLDLDNAMLLASEAFLPYGCVTSANPDDDSFSFTVMSGSGEEVLRVTDISYGRYADPARLAAVLAQARRDLELEGCPLDPWNMPALADDGGVPETTPNY
ncbi:hypothetical protein [Stutzerimonas tarimensis]|uniref:DUF1488 family protein n=1 Tax=Stutzerimonas tarimensis TaxID=1507735 RepID=A0ABV7TCX8_9GAMM